MLRERTLAGMVATALHPERASSYNNVLVDATGGVANVEGSATAAEVTATDDDGHLVHTNHYVCGSMLGYEGDPEYAEYSRGSLSRAPPNCSRARRRARSRWTRCTASWPTTSSAPDSLCRHEAAGRTSRHGVLVRRRRHRRASFGSAGQPLRLRRRRNTGSRRSA